MQVLKLQTWVCSYFRQTTLMEIVTLTIKLAVNKGRDKFALYVYVYFLATFCFFLLLGWHWHLPLDHLRFLKSTHTEVGEPCPDRRVYICGDIPNRWYSNTIGSTVVNLISRMCAQLGNESKLSVLWKNGSFAECVATMGNQQHLCSS